MAISRPSHPPRFILATDYQAFLARKRARQRMLGIACYLGFAPFLWLRGSDPHQNDTLQQHYRHSQAISLLFFFILAATAFTDALGYVYATLVWKPAPGEVDGMLWMVWLFDWTGNFIALAWISTWVIGLVSAIRGRAPRIRVLSALTQSAGWMKFSLGWSIASRIGLILLVVVAAHGSMLASNPGPSPQVYILYTTGGYIPTQELWARYTPPRWAFSLFFYPIILAASGKWGDGSVAIQPLSDVTFKEAIRNGRFVFVASHGGMEAGSFSYAFDPYRGFQPSNLQAGDAGPQLRFVYFAACYAGYLESEWKQALAPAEVQTFARISYVEEHFMWVWLMGAKIIAGLE